MSERRLETVSPQQWFESLNFHILGEHTFVEFLRYDGTRFQQWRECKQSSCHLRYFRTHSTYGGCVFVSLRDCAQAVPQHLFPKDLLQYTF